MMFMRLRRHYANSRIAIQQIRSGEWDFRFNDISDTCCTAHRDGLTLWVGNGGFFCEIEGRRAFGLLFRHYVWWAAARKARREEDAKHVLIDLSAT
jgi:hypothetical protein